MIKQTLALILGISITYLPSLSFAEEPYVGLGIVSHAIKDDDNGFDVKPQSYRFTLGSRIAKNWIAEAYYLSPGSDDTGAITDGKKRVFDIEYSSIFGASINYALVTGPFTFYAGPNLSVADLDGAVNTKESAATLSDTEIDFSNNEIKDKYGSRYSLGGGAGVDINFYKNFSIDFNAQTYLLGDGMTGIGYGAELRYHL